jgi:peptidoglycan/LPS O-acetylase OafA/YrhL
VDGGGLDAGESAADEKPTVQGRLGYRPALDGLRAIAVSAVIAFHYFHHRVPITGGWLGVDLFFLLSGFLITRLMMEEWDSTGRMGLRAFYRRRLARLLPALFVLLGVLTLLVLVFAPFGPRLYDMKSILAALFYGENWLWAFGNVVGIAVVTWSLSLEEQFYVVWALLFIAGHRYLGRRRLKLALIFTLVALFVNSSLRAGTVLHSSALYALPDGQGMMYLVSGCLLALYLPLDRIDAWRWVKPAAAAALLLLSPIVATFYEDRPSYYRGVILLVIAAMSLFLLAALQTGRVATILSRGLLAYIGRLSYGLYLWHDAVLFTVAYVLHQGLYAVPVVAISAVLSLAIAAASYRFVETPLRARFGHRRQPALPASRQAALPAMGQ